MAISDSVRTTAKKIVDTAGIAMEADKVILSNMDLQAKCNFEIMIMQERDLALQAGTIPSIAYSAFKDAFIGRYFLYAIQEVPIVGFEFQRNGGFQGLKDVIYPDSISLTFIENGVGYVKGYLKDWMDEIATYQPLSRDYLFNDDQFVSKRTAYIIPMQKEAIPSTTWIKIEGMKYQQLTGISYDHSMGDNELLTVQFSTENCRLIGLDLI